MATSFHSFCCSSSSVPKLTSTIHTHSLSSSSPSSSSSSSSSCSIISNGYNETSLKRGFLSSRIGAKFDKFEGDSPLDDEDVTATALSSLSASDSSSVLLQQQTIAKQEDDSCLPSDLVGAVKQSSEATALYVSSGGMRAIVELLIPQLTFLDDEGAQAELWELSRVFLDTLIQETGCERVKAIYPDAGAAAMLKYQWKDAAFGFASLSDRKPVTTEDELVVMVLPDYQMLVYVEQIAANLSDPPRPLIMWNPRLINEDVGVGFNVRKLRRYFLRTFTTIYSMKPLPSGAVFRCYPGLWKVFYDDKDRPNRYLLAKELISRPDAEDLEIIYGDVDEKSKDGGPSLFSQAAGIFNSMNRFLKIISK